MRKIVFILFIATLLFSINLVFYILSEDYRFFVKKIKYSDTIVYENIESVSDENNVLALPQTLEVVQDTPVGEPETVVVDQSSLQFLEPLTRETVSEEPLVMTKTEEEILEIFSSFELRELEKHASLFDITTEYPDDYFEYYSQDLVLYFFSTKSYSEIYDIFDILSEELPYDLNEVNNFAQASFFINLKEVYTDEFVRLVVQYENTAF